VLSAILVAPRPLSQVSILVPSLFFRLKKNTSSPSTYNQQKHVRARSNRMGSYPTESTIRDRARKPNHPLEWYQDVFFMDHIWGAAKTWWERLPAVEMSVFQEELIARGLKEHADEVDVMPASIQFPIMYTAVLAGECLEEIDKVNESVVTLDLMVS